MKKMKRLVAVLLAGIMALAMLTACGWKSLGQKYEELQLQVLNQNLTKLGYDKQSNSEDLKNEVLEILGHIDPETGAYQDGYKIPDKITVDTNIIKNYFVDDSGKPIEITEEKIAELQKTAVGDTTEQSVRTEVRVGVASRVVGGKTYGGYVLEFKTIPDTNPVK